MKRKSIVTICAIALMLVLSLSVLAACNKNKHNFSSEWKNDEQYHWHECVTKKHTDVADKAEHTFDAGVVTKDPTEAEEGVKTFTCTVCGYQKTEAVPKLGHTFDMEAWKYDDENHWHPATCGHTDAKKDLGAHVWNEGVVTKDPTETEEGVKTYTCTTCGKTKTATIGKLDHKHTFDMEAWKFDDENHWHPATCGHADEKKDLAAHVWNEGVVTKEPTETEEGVKTYTCTTCGKTKTATIGRLDHVHTFDMTKWSYDTENHWHPATCGHADEKKDLGAHVWNEGVVTKEPNYGVEGEKTFTCTECKATRTEPIAALAAKDNEIELKEGKTLGKEYDGEVVSITKEDFVIEGNREPAFMFKVKGADDNTYAATAPTNVGEYTVKVSVAATAEWKAASNTFDFAIAKADIDGFEISNAAAFEKGFYVGATNIPDPTTNYVEIGTGYGERTIVWEMQLEGGVWSRDLTKEEVMQSKTGTFRVRIKYAEGDNYNFGATQFVSFTLNVKPRTLTVESFAGKTYDGKQVANFTFGDLTKRFGATTPAGVENFTSGLESGEKYVEYRKKGEDLWTKVTDTYIPKNAAEYEYRIGVTATDEWEAVVSEIKSFTIAQVEIKLEKGYVTTSTILQNGDLLYLASYTPVAGETVALRLVNAKAGLELTAPGSGYVKQDQKKKVSIQYNLDCFKLTATTSTNISNYKLVKDPKQTSVEITVPPSGIGTSKLVTGTSQSSGFDPNQKLLAMWTTVNTGSFQVGQTVIVYDNTGTKLFEAKINRVGVVDPDGDGTYNITSQSGCVIPSDGKVCIQVDVTGITYDVNKVKGGTIRVK